MRAIWSLIKKDNVQTLANFLGVKDKDAKTFLVHNGISFNKNGSILATLMVEQLVKKLIWRMKCSML